MNTKKMSRDFFKLLSVIDTERIQSFRVGHSSRISSSTILAVEQNTVTHPITISVSTNIYSSRAAVEFGILFTVHHGICM